MGEDPLVLWWDASYDRKVSHLVSLFGGSGGKGMTNMIVYKRLTCVAFIFEVILERIVEDWFLMDLFKKRSEAFVCILCNYEVFLTVE